MIPSAPPEVRTAHNQVNEPEKEPLASPLSDTAGRSLDRTPHRPSLLAAEGNSRQRESSSHGAGETPLSGNLAPITVSRPKETVAPTPNHPSHTQVTAASAPAAIHMHSFSPSQDRPVHTQETTPSRHRNKPHVSSPTAHWTTPRSQHGSVRTASKLFTVPPNMGRPLAPTGPVVIKAPQPIASHSLATTSIPGAFPEGQHIAPVTLSSHPASLKAVQVHAHSPTDFSDNPPARHTYQPSTAAVLKKPHENLHLYEEEESNYPRGDEGCRIENPAHPPEVEDIEESKYPRGDEGTRTENPAHPPDVKEIVEVMKLPKEIHSVAAAIKLPPGNLYLYDEEETNYPRGDEGTRTENPARPPEVEDIVEIKKLPKEIHSVAVALKMPTENLFLYEEETSTYPRGDEGVRENGPLHHPIAEVVGIEELSANPPAKNKEEPVVIEAKEAHTPKKAVEATRRGSLKDKVREAISGLFTKKSEHRDEATPVPAVTSIAEATPVTATDDLEPMSMREMHAAERAIPHSAIESASIATAIPKPPAPLIDEEHLTSISAKKLEPISVLPPKHTVHVTDKATSTLPLPPAQPIETTSVETKPVEGMTQPDSYTKPVTDAVTEATSAILPVSTGKKDTPTVKPMTTTVVTEASPAEEPVVIHTHVVTPTETYYAQPRESYYTQPRESYYTQPRESYYTQPREPYYTQPEETHYTQPELAYVIQPGQTYYTQPVATDTASDSKGKSKYDGHYPVPIIESTMSEPIVYQAPATENVATHVPVTEMIVKTDPVVESKEAKKERKRREKKAKKAARKANGKRGFRFPSLHDITAAAAKSVHRDVSRPMPVLQLKEDDIKKTYVPVVPTPKFTVHEDDVTKPTLPDVPLPVLTVSEESILHPFPTLTKRPVLTVRDEDVPYPNLPDAPYPVIPYSDSDSWPASATKITNAPRPMIPPHPPQGKELRMPKTNMPKIFSRPQIESRLKKLKIKKPKFKKTKITRLPPPPETSAESATPTMHRGPIVKTVTTEVIQPIVIKKGQPMLVVGVPDAPELTTVPVPINNETDVRNLETPTTPEIVINPPEVAGVPMPIAEESVISNEETPSPVAEKSISSTDSIMSEEAISPVVEKSIASNVTTPSPVVEKIGVSNVEKPNPVIGVNTPISPDVPKPVIQETILKKLEAPKPVIVEPPHPIEAPKPFIVETIVDEVGPSHTSVPTPSNNVETVIPEGYHGDIPKVSLDESLMWVKKTYSKSEYYDPEAEDELDEFGFRKDRDVSLHIMKPPKVAVREARNPLSNGDQRVPYTLANHTNDSLMSANASQPRLKNRESAVL
ncbi:hypothetical protein FBU30_007292 [Linnemannia zychae]|nr:hypothetical protein FBU30_007292 [Linnemannia zychae]